MCCRKVLHRKVKKRAKDFQSLCDVQGEKYLMKKAANSERDTAMLLGKRDRATWQKFYQSTITRVYNFAYYRLGRDHHAAEEVTQEVYLNAYSRIALYEGKGAVEDWLIGIARRRAADYLRNMKKHGGKAVEAAGRHDANRDLPPDEHLARQELADSINVAVAELPANYAAVLKLKYMAKKSVREICREVGSTEKAVESMLSRARQALRRSLEASVGAPAVAALIGRENMFETSIGTILESTYKPVAPSETFIRTLGEKIFSTVKGGGKVISAERVAGSLSRNTAKALIVSGIVAAFVVCCLLVIHSASNSQPFPEPRGLPATVADGGRDEGVEIQDPPPKEQPPAEPVEEPKKQPKDKPKKPPAGKPAEKPEEKPAPWSADMGIDTLCREAELVVIAKYNGTERATGRHGSSRTDMFDVEKILRGKTKHTLYLSQWSSFSGKEVTHFTMPNSPNGRYIIFIRKGKIVLLPATRKNVDKVEKNPWLDKTGKAPLMLDLTATSGGNYEWLSRTQTYALGMEVGQILTVQGCNQFPTWKFKEAKLTAGDGVVAVEKKEGKGSDYFVVLKALKKGDATIEFHHHTAPEPGTGKVMHPRIAAVLKIKVGKQQAVKKIKQGELKFPGFEGATDEDPRFGWTEQEWKSKLYTVRKEDVTKWLKESKDIIKCEKGDNLTQFHLVAAMCHQALGEKDKAVEHYKEAAECLDPGWRAQVKDKTGLFFDNIDKLRKVIEGRIEELSR
jgi:RNA polymerase sigma-70 factor (ECF subfamily)